MLRVKHKIMRLFIGAVAVVALALAALGGATPAAHADDGVYPVGVYGPHGTCCYGEAGVWYDGVGRGFAGYARYTFSNGNQESSRAGWDAGGLDANTLYDICAYIPNDNANANAQYTVTAINGDSTITVNQQAYSNQWAFIAEEYPINGHIRVVVSDKNNDPLPPDAQPTVVGADAMAFIPTYNDTIDTLTPDDAKDLQCLPNLVGQ
jgi:hypothetical protein